MDPTSPPLPVWAVMVVGIAVLVGCVLAVLRHRRNPGAAWLLLSLLACIQWSVAYLFELGADDLAGRELWGAVKYLGAALLPASWLLFVLSYTGRVRAVPGWLVAVLFAEPVLVWVLLTAPSTRTLIREYPADGPTVASAGPLFWPHTWYSYVVIGAATALLVVSLARMSRVYRWTCVVLIASIVPPYVANAMFNLSIPPLDTVDLTSFLFAGTALVLIVGLFRARLPQLRPLARRQVFDTLPAAVFVLDPYDRTTDANPAARGLLRTAMPNVLGRPFADLVPAARDVLFSIARNVEATALVRHEGRTYDLMLSPVRAGQSIVGRLAVLRDVSERQALEERLAWQAMHDPLTRLANRRLLREHIMTSLAHARRGHADTALLCLDIDDFKRVNDTFGHAAGDTVLVELSRRIDLACRSSDTTARLGGDEFAILLDGPASEAGAVKAAEHVLAELGGQMRIDDSATTVRVSIGIAVGCPAEPEMLLQAADSALYRAKRAGGGRYAVQRVSTPRPRLTP